MVNMAPSVNLCLEPACLQASAHVLLNMAPDYKRFDPCTQFEEMICPGFRVNNPKDTFGLVKGNSATIAIEKILMDMSYEQAVNVRDYLITHHDERLTLDSTPLPLHRRRSSR